MKYLLCLFIIFQLEPSAADHLDSRGRNFLHTAILKDDLEAVLFLISVRANVNTRTQDPSSLSGGSGNGGLTPLVLAVSKGNTMIVRNLILAGASVADLNPGISWLRCMVLNIEMKYPFFLISYFYYNIITAGQTALQVAAENGLAEVCSILLSNAVNFTVVDNRGKL
jgi:ankyrin repeat protein